MYEIDSILMVLELRIFSEFIHVILKPGSHLIAVIIAMNTTNQFYIVI